ncbi:MAG TPA: signal peptide peptidase SppA [Thermoanaerobaculia bacterium]|nr:signal peptide peptidase SppA [Thermoanaerobaculia bacterium]
MKKLVLIFVLLLGVAALATVAGLLLARGGAAAGGPTVLVWHLVGPVLEQAVPVLPFSDTVEADSLAELYPAFRAAREDRQVRGLAVYIEDAQFGLARAQELRRQFMALRRAGKFVECYLETAGEGSNGTLVYYLASACERIHMSPLGDVNLIGLAIENRFFKGTLEKLKIVPEFNKVGRYKSAVETYTEAGYSPAAEEAMAAILDGYYTQIVTAVAEARKKTPDEIRWIIDGAPYGAEDAVRRGLIDQISYPDQFRDHLKKRAGGDATLLPVEDYAPATSITARRVAVVFASGTIVRGTGGSAPWTEEAYVGSNDLSSLLRDMAEDSSVAAVVLRIDSPGGSALASDLILREVEKLKESKPLIVSMSDLAASGGYYIAAKADKIVAEPATLTGSIGIFGGKFITRGFEEEMLGLSSDSLKRGANADMYSSLHPYTPEQSMLVQRQMDKVYSVFVGHVATGRRMSRQQVEGVASGRVWTGAAAKKLGLVDELGGLDRAIELAREAGGIGSGEDAAVVFYPEPESWLSLLFEERPPRLPAALTEVVKGLEITTPRLLQLPPEAARLTRPF